MMAVELSSLVILLISIPLVSLVLLKLANRQSTKKKTNSRLPPGPRKLPLIGNMHQLAHGLPYRVLRDLAKQYGPLMHLKLGEVSAIVVSSPETAELVLKTYDLNFASRAEVMATKILCYGCRDIAFAPYSESWRQLRKICVVELLSMRRVQSFYKIREEEFGGLVRWIASNAGSAINLTENLISTTAYIISRAAFGKKTEDHETFIKISKAATTLAEGFNVADLFPSIKLLRYINTIKPKLEKHRLQIDRIMEKIIQEHRTRKSSTISEEETYEDLVDVLLKTQQEGAEFSLTTENIKAVLLDMFGGGGETSSTTVDWAMCEMLKNPSILQKAQAEVRQVFNNIGYVAEASLHELKYLKAIIKETLRLHTPAPILIPRECRETCEINGYEIPVKTRVIVNAWALARDPSYWKDPECFKPERFLDSPIDYKGTNFEYIPFGAGRRICPGIAFGIANVELPLAKMLYHFDWYLPNGMKSDEIDMTPAPGLAVRRKHDLHVIPVIYKS